MINRGPAGAGFRLCEYCGFAEPVIQGKRPKRTHRRIDRPTVECRGSLRYVQLGHEYLTDVIEIRLGRPLQSDEARSTLYALLEAAPALDIAREDIDGTLHYYAANQPSFVLFDAVPGGAGRTGSRVRRAPAPNYRQPHTSGSSTANAVPRHPVTTACATTATRSSTRSSGAATRRAYWSRSEHDNRSRSSVGS